MKKNKRKKPAPSVKPPVQANGTTSRVSPPRNLTPELCTRLRRDLLSACLTVAEAHGLKVEGGALSDIDLRHGFDIGFRVGIPMEDGALYSADKAMFEVLAQHFGLEASDHGRTFKARGEAFRIIAINPNRPKYPISVERVADGRGFKFPSEEVVLYLQNAGNKIVP